MPVLFIFIVMDGDRWNFEDLFARTKMVLFIPVLLSFSASLKLDLFLLLYYHLSLISCVHNQLFFVMTWTYKHFVRNLAKSHWM